MYKATATFTRPATRISCGIDNPASMNPIEASAAATMKHALRMLLPAMMRERCCGSLRDWISAYRGTM